MLRVFSKHPVLASLAVALALFALYTGFGYFIAPKLIQRAVADYAAERLERKASVGEVRVNPLKLTLEVKEFALAEANGAPILGFGRLYADFDASSLFRWAWTFSEIALDKPALHADIAPDGTLNLARLLAKLERRPAEKPLRLRLRRLALSAGSVTLSDRSDPTPASTAISPIDFELHELSTLPDKNGNYSLRARFADGGTLAWSGTVSLEPLSSQGEVRVAGMKPLTLWRFLRDELAVDEPRGEVDYSARYRAAYAKGVPQLSLEDIRVAGRGIVILASGAKEPILAVSSASAAGGRFDLASREFVLPAVEVSGGSVAVEVDKDGSIDWSKLVRPGWGSRAPARDAGAPAEPWKARADSFRLAGFALRYVDRSRKRPIRIVAKEAAVNFGAKLEIRPGGIHALVEGLAVNLAKLGMGDAGARKPLVELDTVGLEGGSMDLEARRATIGRLAIKGGLVEAARDRNGTVDLVDLVAPGDAGLLRRGIEGAVKEAKAEGRPWQFAIDAIDLSGTRLALSDQTLGETVAYDAEIQLARVSGYRSDGKAPVKVETNIRLAQGGSLAASGVLRTSGDEFKGRVKLDGLSLKPLRPALLRRISAELADAALSVDVKAEYRARGDRRELRASGLARIDNLRLDTEAGGERLLAWKSLAANGVSLSLAPDELRVDEVRIAGLDAKVIVYKDRSVNLVKAIKVEPRPAEAGAAPAAEPQGTTIADLEPAFPVTVGRVVLEQGTVDFADQSLVLPFATEVQELNGVVQGLASDRASRAVVRLEGRVAEYGLARAEGSLSPFRPKSFLDLNVTFRNVDMPPLSPYTVTFAGRRIQSGRLALDLQYKIDNGTLAGENRVVLEKFTLGERVKAPGALDLPLDLAVALLTDSKGRIDLAVPVHGNVDDPQFSYGHLIWQAIRNVITRIVTAPFRALGALFGGGGESLESIAFDPGRATLLPPEREKLKRVAEGLGKRPQLRLVAEGQHGPADRAALRQRDVGLAVAARLGRPPAADDSPEPVNVTDAKTQRALEAIFVERQSEQALSQFAAETGTARGKEVQRVNAALALIGRGSADREFYEALLKRLNETASVPDAALGQLAGARASAVAEYLATALAVPAARIEARTAAASGAAEVKLSFAVARPETRDESPAGQAQPVNGQ